MTSFSDFPLSPETLDGLRAMNFERPLPIQEKVIPAALEGRDIVGCSQTGTGKTAAFVIPIMEGLLAMQPAGRYRPQALVLTPTRELAQQVCDHFEALAQFTRLRSAALYGGMEIHEQDRALGAGVELIVATPGRLLEHLSRGGLKFSAIEFLVLDEADRLLDSGFLPELREIVDALPDRRQTMLFSATTPPEMEQLARAILFRPERIQIGQVSTRETLEESLWPVPESQKIALLQDLFLKEAGELDKAMVFVRTRAKARTLTPMLREVFGLPTAELHAELSQAERNETLLAFRNGEIRLLVTTDVGARGLDIPQVSHVVNFDVPNTPDDYIHRVGRTGRVDRLGIAWTLVSPEDLTAAASIEAATRRRLPMRRLEGFPYDVPPPDEKDFLASAKAPRRHQGSARNFVDRRPVDPKSKKSPFTKSGQLAPEFRSPEDQDDRQRRKHRKRLEKRLLNKKLPHRRKKG